MSSSHSETYNQTWQQLVGRFQEEIAQHSRLRSQHHSLTRAYDESTFRNEFEELCRHQGEMQYPRLQARLQFHSINNFVTKVDSVEDHSPQNSLASVVYGGTFVAVQAASSIDISPAKVVDLLGKLNLNIPQVGAKVETCAASSRLQRLLREIFYTYMDALLAIIAAYSDGVYAAQSRDPSQSLRHRLDTVIIRDLKRLNDSFQREYDRFLQTSPRLPDYGGSLSTRHSISSQDMSKLPQSDRYKLQRVLGHGSRGVEVYCVKKVSTDREFARKRIPLVGSREENLALEAQISNEVNVMDKLQHIHTARILETERLYASQPAEPGAPGAYDLFIKPIAETTLKGYMNHCCEDGFPEQSLDRIVPWFGCLLNALCYSHRKKIAHMDIKPTNILILGDEIWLADFGISKDFSRTSNSNTLGDEGFGTPAYRAPELLSGTSREFSADVFSLGCVFSEMLTTCARRSLIDYEAYRNNAEARPRGAFRHNLDEVRSWIGELDGRVPARIYETTRFLVFKMMGRTPLERQTAESFLPVIQADPSFCCKHE